MPPADQDPDSGNQYDRFADIYAVWTDTAPAARANLPFYSELYVAAEGPVVELGVGDGRIAVEAARRGARLVGVDASARMLERCQARATAAGVADRLTLLQADFRTFELDTPAALIALPYHSLGHLTAIDDKREALARVFEQLRPGGRFVFDDFVVTDRARAHMRQAQLRSIFKAPDGTDRLLWVTSLLDDPGQRITVITWEDTLDDNGRQIDRQYRKLELSWLTPEQAQTLLEDVGFKIDSCWGDFERTTFDPTRANEQIWVVRRPNSGSRAA
jgi:SAM-dependent methyltransferase